MRMIVYSICGLVLLAVTSSVVAQANSGEITLVNSRWLGEGEDFEGNWEYVYDLNITGMSYLSEHGLSGFDTAGILNQWEYDPYQYDILPHGTLVQYWSWWPANDYGDELCFGSYSTDFATWTLHGGAWSIDNTWHAPPDYTGGSGILKAPAWYTGLIDAENDSLAYSYRRGTGTALTGMVMTFRIVHPNEPGTIDWWVSNKETSASDSFIFTDFGTVVGPSSGASSDPGDFDDDGDVDSDDIGLLCANLTGSGNPAGDPMYDLDGDGDADQDDMDMLIHDLVEITGGDGTGTEYGDFDLDGDIDTTDLTILATNYGVGTTWALGNANCDLVIDTTDLTIMATNFGFLASGAVPEPATLFLMGCGAIGLLRKRRRA